MIKRNSFFIILLLLFFGLSFARENLAEFMCKENNGIISNQKNFEGNEYQICKFKDGSSCLVWEYYKGSCFVSQSLLDNNTINIIDKSLKNYFKKHKSLLVNEKISLYKGIINKINNFTKPKISNKNLLILNYIKSKINYEYESITNNIINKYSQKYFKLIEKEKTEENTDSGKQNDSQEKTEQENDSYKGMTKESLEKLLKSLQKEYDSLIKKGYDIGLAQNIGKNSLSQLDPDSTIGYYKVGDLLRVLLVKNSIDIIQKKILEGDYSYDSEILYEEKSDSKIENIYLSMTKTQLETERKKLANEYQAILSSGVSLSLAKSMGIDTLKNLPKSSNISGQKVGDLLRLLEIVRDLVIIDGFLS